MENVTADLGIALLLFLILFERETYPSEYSVLQLHCYGCWCIKLVLGVYNL